MVSLHLRKRLFLSPPKSNPQQTTEAQNWEDRIILGKQSEYAIRERQLLDEGKSFNEAQKQAFAEIFFYQPLEDAAYAFATGGTLGGVSAIGGTYSAGRWAGNNLGDYRSAIEGVEGADYTSQKGRAEALRQDILKWADRGENARTGLGETMARGRAVAGLKQLQKTRKLIITQSASENANLDPYKRQLLADAAAKTDADIVVANLNDAFKTYKAGDSYANGMWYSQGNTLFIDPRATVKDIETAIATHEMTHAAESSRHYNDYFDYVKERLGTDEFERRTAEVMKEYDNISKADAEKEVVAFYTQNELFQNPIEMQDFIARNYSIANRVIDSLKDAHDKVNALFGRETSDNGLRYFERALGTRQPGVDTGTRYEIKTTSDGKQYVQANRKIFKSDNPENWGKELEDYINNEIRHGRDVIIPTSDGDSIKITDDTAWKIGDMHGWTEDTFPIKMRMGAHLDELLEISKFRKNKEAGDRSNKRFQADSFDNRVSYFRDVDGKYYRINITVGVDKNGKTAYSIGKDIQKRSFPSANGSSAPNRRRSWSGAPQNYDTTFKDKSQDFSEKTDMQIAMEKAGIDETTFKDGQFSKSPLTEEEAQEINERNSQLYESLRDKDVSYDETKGALGENEERFKYSRISNAKTYNKAKAYVESNGIAEAEGRLTEKALNGKLWNAG